MVAGRSTYLLEMMRGVKEKGGARLGRKAINRDRGTSGGRGESLDGRGIHVRRARGGRGRWIGAEWIAHPWMRWSH